MFVLRIKITALTKIHATTFLYTVFNNILQNVTLNYYQHFKIGCIILAIGCYKTMLLVNQDLLGEKETPALTAQLSVPGIVCTKPITSSK
jgi:hypothetical protein